MLSNIQRKTPEPFYSWVTHKWVRDGQTYRKGEKRSDEEIFNIISYVGTSDMFICMVKIDGLFIRFYPDFLSLINGHTPRFTGLYEKYNYELCEQAIKSNTNALQYIEPEISDLDDLDKFIKLVKIGAIIGK